MKRLGSIRHSEQSTDSTNGLELDRLIYLICKSYIDDVLIDGADEDTFVNNVRHVSLGSENTKLL